MRKAHLLWVVVWLLLVQVLNGQTNKNDFLKKSYSQNKAASVERINYATTQKENATHIMQPLSAFSGKSDLDCPENSLYSNPLSEYSYTDFMGASSIIATSFNIDGIIDTVVFWGINFYWDENWFNCSNEDPMVFDVVFYEKDGNGIGAEYCSYQDVEAIRNFTGDYYNTFHIIKCTLVLDTPCDLSNGFIGLKLDYQYSGSCTFKWLNSLNGTGTAYQRYDQYDPWSGADFPYSICLIGEPNSCLAPVNLFYSINTVSTANLAWTELNVATKWQVELSNLETNQVSSTIIDADSNPYLVDGLNAESIYKFSVRSVCAEADTSQWSIPLKFETTCIVVTDYPLTENFDDDWNSWCWKIGGNILSGQWIQSDLYNTAPWLSGKYVAFGIGENKGYLISPALALDGAYQFSWWHKAERSGFPCTYEILVSNTGINPSDFKYNLGTFTCNTDDWVKRTLFLDAFQGQTIYVAIHQTSTAHIIAHTFGMGIEDVTIELKPDCIPVTILLASNVTKTSAQLCWSENGDAVAWNIEYGAYGFKPGEGTQIHTTQNPFLLTGLSPGFSYQFYIQPDCGNGISYWEGPCEFTTLCEIATDISESFEDKVPPFCWKTYGGVWQQCASLVNQGSYSATVFFYQLEQPVINEGWLVTQQTFIPVGNALSFFASDGGYPNYGSKLSVKISTAPFDYNPGYVDLLTIDATNEATATFTQYIIDLSSYAGKNVYLAFVMYDYMGDQWYIDDVTFVTGLVPFNFATGNLTPTSATITWESNGQVFNTEYGPYGFTLGQGISNLVFTPSINISGLEPSHNYDFYVKAYCTNLASTTWAGPFTFSTSNLPCVDIVEFPYFEGFEGQNKFTCWTPMYNTANDGGLNGSNLVPPSSENSWVIITPESLYNGGSSYIFEGIRAAYINKYAPNFNWLISPNIVMPNGGGNLNFRIWYNNDVWANRITKFYVTIFNGNVWKTALTCDENTPINLYSDLVEVNLSEYSNQTIKIAYVYEQNNGYEMAIDDITINGYTILNNETNILTYSIAGETEDVIINPTYHTIDVLVAGGTDLNASVAYFTLSAGATVKVGDIVQVSGQTINNFYNNSVIYKVIAEDGVTLQNWIVTVTPNGIVDNWANTIKIYPNPTNDKIMVEGVFGKKAILKILDVTGKLVNTVDIKCNKQIIDLAAIENGVYFIEIATKNQQAMFKIFKQ